MTSHNKFKLFRSAHPSLAGFTLVELMVGLAIGMLATLVVMQVFSVFETQKRTTTGSADAQTDGNIALYNITRDVQMAGYGLDPTGQPAVPDSGLECGTGAPDFSGMVAASAVLSPVAVTEGGSGNGGDSIAIGYATSPTAGIPTVIKTVTGTTLDVEASLGCHANDIVLAINGTNCALTRLAAIPNPVVPYQLTLKDDQAITAGAVAPTTGRVACLGAWNTITYSVAGGNLLQNGVPVVAGIVNLQAQYGVAAAGLASNHPDFNKITAWVDANTAPFSSPGTTDRNRIKAVRIAVVARTAARSEAIVSSPCSSTTAANPTGVCAWDPGSTPLNSPAPAVNLSVGDPDWDHYRYKVFETIIPLRNVIWAKGTL